VNIIVRNILSKIGVLEGQLVSYGGFLVGFFGERVRPLRYVKKNVVVRVYPKRRKIQIKFVIVDGNSTYNVFLG